MTVLPGNYTVSLLSTPSPPFGAHLLYVSGVSRSKVWGNTAWPLHSYSSLPPLAGRDFPFLPLLVVLVRQVTRGYLAQVRERNTSHISNYHIHTKHLSSAPPIPSSAPLLLRSVPPLPPSAPPLLPSVPPIPPSAPPLPPSAPPLLPSAPPPSSCQPSQTAAGPVPPQSCSQTTACRLETFPNEEIAGCTHTCTYVGLGRVAMTIGHQTT